MKIKIGPYRNWIGPYQIADFLCFWAKDVEDEYGIKSKPDWVHDFGSKLADTKLADFCQWIEDKKERKVKIHIDKYDTWSMDNTLSMIIVPMLKQLQATKHGSPMVDDEDVPEELRSTNAPPVKEWNIGSDNNVHKRWEWVMDEMIWAHERNLIDWESQFHTGEHDRYTVPVDKEGNEVPEDEAEHFEMRKGPNDTSKFDKEGYKIHAERMANGFRLFGKYYQGLWD